MPSVASIERLAASYVSQLEKYEREGMIIASRLSALSIAATMRAAGQLGGDPVLAFNVSFRKSVPMLASVKAVSEFRAIRDGQVAFIESGATTELAEDATAKEAAIAAAVIAAERRSLLKVLGLDANAVSAIDIRSTTEASSVLGSTRRRMNASILDAMVAKKTLNLSRAETLKLVQEAFVTHGFAPDAAASMQSIFRTEIAKSYAVASWKFDQRPEIREALWGYRYVTRRDNRVRRTHQLLDGTTLPKEHPRWREITPPNGFNCRCVLVRLFSDPGRIVPVPDPVREMQGGQLVDIVPGADPGFRTNFGAAA